MAEVLSSEAQAAADRNAGMQLAVDERANEALAALNKRGAEFAADIVAKRAKDAEEADKAAKAEAKAAEKADK